MVCFLVLSLDGWVVDWELSVASLSAGILPETLEA